MTDLKPFTVKMWLLVRMTRAFAIYLSQNSFRSNHSHVLDNAAVLKNNLFPKKDSIAVIFLGILSNLSKQPFHRIPADNMFYALLAILTLVKFVETLRQNTSYEILHSSIHLVQFRLKALFLTNYKIKCLIMPPSMS